MLQVMLLHTTAEDTMAC